MNAETDSTSQNRVTGGHGLAPSPVGLSPTAISCLRRSVELIERITPGNCSHHAGNIRVMLRAVLDEAERKPNAEATESQPGAGPELEK